MPSSLIRWDDHRLVPWRNGKGMTRELAKAEDAGGAVLWRLSIATVDRDGPFSDFTGYRRVIMLLEGKGMVLDFGDHGGAVLDRPFVPVGFDGGWPTSATLIDGPTRDFNVVTAQDGASAAVEVLGLATTARELAPSHATSFLYLLSGAATAQIAERRETLAAGDALRLDGAGQIARVTARGDGALACRIDIDLAGDRGGR